MSACSFSRSSPPPAYALTISATSCSVQSDNVLRYDCSSTTDVSANSWMRFCEGSSCSPLSRASTTSTGGTSHAMTIYNLKPSTTYTWQGVASLAGSPVYGPVSTFTTGSLSGEPELARLSFSTSGSPGPLNNLLFPFAHQFDTTSPDYDWLVITDTSGNIVWYQDPSDDLGSNMRISALSLTRPEKHILAIIGEEFIVEYEMTGALDKIYCKDHGAHSCLNSVIADQWFDNFVSHDVVKANGRIWALNSSNAAVSDPNQCDGEDEYSPVIVDGVYGWDYSDDSLDFDWAMTEEFDLSYGSDCGDGPGYWYGRLEGSDVTHANSIWVDANNGLTISREKTHDILYLDADPLSGTFREILWTIAGDDSGDDFSRTTTSFDDEFGSQHAAFWTGDGTLMIYDNHRGAAMGDSRGIEMDVDFTYLTTEILNEYSMGHVNDTGGSAFDMLPSGNVIATTPYEADHTVFKEFNGTNSVVWSMTMTCDGSTSCVRGGPSYRGIANPF